MTTATKPASPARLQRKIEGLKAREAKLAEALGKVRVDRRLLEGELKDVKAAAKTKKAGGTPSMTSA